MCLIVIYHIHINFIFDGIQCILIKVYTFLILPSSGQTLALAEPEARHYNHPATDPAAYVCNGYISAFSQQNESRVKTVKCNF